MSAPDPEIIVGVPGCWESQDDILRSIASANIDMSNPEYLAMGMIMSRCNSDEVFRFEIYDADPQLSEVFQRFGSRFSEEELAAIQKHTYTVYLIADQQSIEVARAILVAANFLLSAGGIGVKVECSGTCHPPALWRHFAENPDYTNVYDAFTMLVSDDDGYTTCGMHQFGLRDAFVIGIEEINEANALLAAFNLGQMVGTTKLLEAEMFAIANGEPFYELTHSEFGYPEDSLLNNPNGLWQLVPRNRKLEDSKYSYSEPMFIAVAANSLEVQECISNAQKSLDYFVAHFQNKREYGTYRFKFEVDDDGIVANLWAWLTEVTNEGFRGEIFELPKELRSRFPEGRVSVERRDVKDWAITKHHAMIGGFSMRLQREKIPEDQRHRSDLYSGIVAYLPLEDIPGCSF